MNIEFQENVEQWKKNLLWEGELKGKATMLSCQIQRRFGDAPSWASDKIAKADLPVLEEWGLRILDAKSLKDVFGD